MYSYKTRGTCSREIKFDVKDGILTDVAFVGGCAGNTVGVALLAKNRPIDELITMLEHVDCAGRGTSCPAQLAMALKQYKEQSRGKEAE